jgi:hypothetical protein
VVDVGRVKSDNVAASEVAVRFLYALGLADVVMNGFVESVERLEMGGRGGVDGLFEGKDVERGKGMVTLSSKEGGGFGG